jgi:hypothetical protein
MPPVPTPGPIGSGASRQPSGHEQQNKPRWHEPQWLDLQDRSIHYFFFSSR